MVVYRNSIVANQNELKDLKFALRVVLTQWMAKDHPQRKKYLRYYKAFQKGEERAKED